MRRATTVLVLLAVMLMLLPLAASAQTSGTSTILVKLVSGLSIEQQAAVIARNGGTELSAIPVLRLRVIAVPTADVTTVLAAYQADPQVQSAELDKTRTSESIPNDPLYANQWALPLIGWDQVFGVVTPLGSAKVAILDTGVDAAHPDLAGSVVPGTSILDGSNGTTDPSGHGTWLAGIIAAQTNTLPLEGIAGIAYAGVQVMPVTVLNANGEGQDSDVIAGVVWAADHGADVILMAFSAPEFSPNLQDAIDYAWSRGVVVVAAVGNNAVNAPTFPAGDRGVMGVAATDATDSLASFSNDGQAVFIAAPGVDIQTTDSDGNYIVISGTSASSAYVAGLAAFMKAVDPLLTNGIIVGRIARNADPAGTQEQTGNGRINMARALADTSTEFVQPAGADPVGNGGPFIGPYVAAARQFDLTFAGGGGGSVTITLTNPGTVDASASCGGSGGPASTQTVTSTCANITFSNNNATGTLTATANATSAFAGWSVPINFSGCTGTTNPCSFTITGSGPELTVTFNGGRTTSTSVALSPSTVVVGQASTATVTVQDTNPGTKKTPTGTVGITVGVASDAVVGTCTLSETVLGTATCSVTVTPAVQAGTHTITATFTATTQHSGSTGNATLTVNKANTTTTITTDLSAATVVGEGYTVAVSVAAAAPGSGTPSGSVSVSDGTDSCTIATLASGAGSCTLTSTSVGAKTITATYGGDSNFNGSSGTKAHTVNKADTTTTITTDLSAATVVGQAYAVAVSVAALAPGSGTPTGSVSVSDGTDSCTIATLASGAGSCSLTSTTAGAKTITATYAGDSKFNDSSGTKAHTVSKGNTTTTITTDLSASTVVGQGYSVAVSVAAVAPASGTPGGSVTVSDGTDSCSIGTLAAGAGSCTLTSTTAGAKTITATYNGDSNFNGSSGTKAHTVDKANTTTTITTDLSAATVVGQGYTVAVSVAAVAPASGTPGGSVTVSDGTDSCSIAALASGVGSCTLTSTTAGAKTITATYNGDTNFNSSAGTKAHTVSKAATTTTITSDTPDPSVVGQVVVVAYSVVVTAPGSGTPTGNVTVSDGAVSCTGTVAAGNCTLTFTTAGAKTLTAAYAGDANFNDSTSASEAHTVNKADTTTTITADTPDPSVVGQAVTVSFSVVVQAPGAGTPTGNVTVSDGTVSCTGTVAAGNCTLTFTTAASKTLTAAYAGDLNFKGSTSAPETHQVNKGDTTTTITTDLSASTVVGQGYSVAVSVAAVAPAAGAPTGNVTVSDGTDSCSIAALAGGVGSCTLTSTTAGAKTITATYSGDTNFNGSAGTKAHTVSKAGTTTTITADTPDPSVVGQAVTVAYSVVVNAPGAGTPTGYVTVSDGTVSCTGTVAAGSCTLTFTTAGVKSLTATYAGNANFNGSTSASEAHTVNKADTTTTITADTPDPSVVGQLVTVSYSVTVNAPGAGTPAGNVTVSDGTVSCTGTVAAGQCTLTFTSAGAKSLTATYAGNANLNGSTSAPEAHTVNKADTTTTITSDLSAATLVGQGYSVAVSVTAAAPGSGTPTGSVTVSDGTDTCTIASLAGGVGSCTLTSTTVGLKTITATYGGDSNFNGSSGSQTHHVNYGFLGLQSPYAPPSDRAFKVKSTIPLKWQYTNAANVPVPTPNAAPVVLINKVDCSGIDGTQDIVVEDAGNSGLQYDPTTFMWQFNWKTTGLAASCYNIKINAAQEQSSPSFKIQLVR